MTASTDRYDELEEKAARGDLTVLAAGRVRDGSRVSEGELDALFAGRPKLGHTHATGTGRSPRRQVRLPEDVDAALGAYAAQHHTTPSAVIREAVNEYLANA